MVHCICDKVLVRSVANIKRRFQFLFAHAGVFIVYAATHLIEPWQIDQLPQLLLHTTLEIKFREQIR